MHALEGALADAVVGQWAVCVAVGTEGHAGVVGGFQRPCRPRFLCARLRWVRNRLFAEQIHQDNTDVYPAAPGARRFVKVESYEARSGKASSDNNWNRLIGAHGVVVHS